LHRYAATTSGETAAREPEASPDRHELPPVFIWGSWLLTIGAYWFQNKHWSGTSFGAIFSTMGIASLFMPSIAGIIADKWINAERLYGAQIAGARAVLRADGRKPTAMFWVMLLNMIFYMPTIALAIAVGYNALKNDGKDVVIDTRRSRLGHDRLHRRAVDREPAASGNFFRAVLRRLGGIAGARTLRIHAAEVPAETRQG
jgi:Nucleoside H+ symporter.